MKYRIFIVEDDETIANLLKNISVPGDMKFFWLRIFPMYCRNLRGKILSLFFWI